MTNREDVTADLVVLRLQERGVSYLRFNTEDVLEHAQISLVPGAPDESTLTLRRGGVSLAEISAVWFRRPVAARATHVPDPTAARFAVQEGEAALRNLWVLLAHARWVSPADRLREAQPRLHQLAIARACGLEVPPTLVTNDPNRARAFVARYPVVVAKAIGVGHVADGQRDVALYATRLEREEIDMRIGDVASAPVLLQECIDKCADVRVTVVGERVFATEITVPGSSVLDWRSVPYEALRQRPTALPPAIEQGVVQLVRSLGLRFGAIDLARREDGSLVFLEINPNGQWGWIEQELGTPISDAIVDLLAADD